MSRVLMKRREVEKQIQQRFKCGPGGSPCKADSFSGGLWGGFVFIFVPETHHCNKQGLSVSVKGVTDRVYHQRALHTNCFQMLGLSTHCTNRRLNLIQVTGTPIQTPFISSLISQLYR